MGFFSGIRRRIKKLIPKEVRPAIPFIASALIPGPAASGLFKSAIGNQFMAAAAAKAATDDEANLKDIFRTGAIAAAPTAIGSGLEGIAGRTSNEALKKIATKGAEYIANTDGKGLTGLKKVGGQTALDFGIKQAELNEKALEQYNADLLSRGIRDKAARRGAIFDIFVNAGYDDDEVNVMLDKYGYADGGKVKMAGYLDPISEKNDMAMEMFGKQLKDLTDSELELLDEEIDRLRSKFMADGGKVMKASMSLKEILELADATNKAEKKKKKRISRSEGGGTDFIFGAELLKKINPETGELFTVEEVEEYLEKAKGFDSDKFSSNLSAGISGLEKAFGEPLGGRRPEPMRIIPGFAEGGDVDILETEEEIITPEYLMKEEGVPIGEQVSNPDKMDSLNQLSLMLFNKPVFELTEEQFEMLKEFASDQAKMQVGYEPGKYSDDEIEMYENYKYNMNEQMPGMPIIDIDEFLRMEYGAARMGVAKGGPIKTQKPDMEKDTKGKMAAPDYYVKRMEALMDLGYDYDEAGRIAMDFDEYQEAIDKGPVGDAYKQGGVIKKKRVMSIATGKLKDYPGIKKILEMNKKGKKRFSKAEGGLMNMGGNELDLRGGGFVPMGKKEKADDVPARLSKNEFVMTADAVRAAGGGSVQKGADLMYDTMKKLEAQS